MSNLDFIFIEFYIRKKHGKSVDKYFNVGKMSVSSWRSSNIVPPKRLIEFHQKEKSLDILELFKKLYDL